MSFPLPENPFFQAVAEGLIRFPINRFEASAQSDFSAP